MDQIDVDALETMLCELRGATIISLVAVTNPTLLKKHRQWKFPCPWKSIEKVNRVTGVINWAYSNAVNKQRERESSIPYESTDVTRRSSGTNVLNRFVANQRSWGHRRFLTKQGKVVHSARDGRGTPIVDYVKDGTHFKYLELKLQGTIVTLYRDAETLKEISDDSLLQGFLKKPSVNRRQCVKKQIELRDYGLETIRRISIKGRKYWLEPAD